MFLDLFWVLFGGGYVASHCLKEGFQKARYEQNPYWWTNKHYDPRRQQEIEHMCIWEKEKVAKLLGRPFKGACLKETREAVTELLAREGLDYYDYGRACIEESRATNKWWRKW